MSEQEESRPYYIYGRTEYETPLTFVKEIRVKASVTDETLADVGQAEWIELIAIPAAALIHVIGEKTND